jgi:hypothetical protein
LAVPTNGLGAHQRGRRLAESTSLDLLRKFENPAAFIKLDPDTCAAAARRRA